MKWRLRRLVDALVAGLFLVLPSARAHAASVGLGGHDGQTVSVEQLEGRIRVEMDGELFTEYIHADTPRPILYPVIGPHGLPMTRNYPMKPGVAGEAEDHPHHRSLWFTHGDVNGVSFWHEAAGAGKIVHADLVEARGGKGHGVIRARNRWVDSEGRVRCTESRAISFRSAPGGRAIDIKITVHASEGDLTFGDTKEGSMAIRTHPNLRLRNDPERGVTTAGGQAINSEGVGGKAVWGKRAAWVDYWGPIEGKTVGVAIFDHPSNPRHPTWWHAREYGLIAANPFGVHDFEDKPEGEGDMTIKAGDSVTFLYRFFFHEGDSKQARIAERYREFSSMELPED